MCCELAFRLNYEASVTECMRDERWRLKRAFNQHYHHHHHRQRNWQQQQQQQPRQGVSLSISSLLQDIRMTSGRSCDWRWLRQLWRHVLWRRRSSQVVAVDAIVSIAYQSYSYVRHSDTDRSVNKYEPFRTRTERVRNSRIPYCVSNFRC